ncbi:COX15/CtaA family protein [Piscinibacter sp. Jin2]|uniref:COX15/CtaA family protein n=1 Tax=Aquariibacter lacus TaxID=2801332 RepID=A0A9X1BN47_9BURK|nr:COX15/CtaA family protein [Piscinibacter lacus]MBL0719207.1 COX15/CtaA family protein [Piscinibacter lacus]
MDTVDLVNWSPLAQMAGLGLLIAGLPLAWVAWRHRKGGPEARRRALVWVTLFLTFDLVLFGAFTRLTDSGLGCPDWPGCYGEASPLGARAEIDAEQSLRPDGPVTLRKAWIEMIHRYLATGVGVLIIAITVGQVRAWRAQRGRGGPAEGETAAQPLLALFTLAWVCLQGAFGAWTVTLKLYPAIVTAHLLGGLTLLGLLTALAAGPERARWLPLASPGLRAALWGLLALAVVQISLGGWVSTNYAVLACTDFPTCQGRWWPAMDFEHGFAIFRPLGTGKDGDWLPFEALTAIHVTHRLGALVVLGAMLATALMLFRRGPELRPAAASLAGLAAWQLASGVSNVVLGWPLLAAVAHTGGAAVLIMVLLRTLLRLSPGRSPAEVAGPAVHPVRDMARAP